MKSALDLVAAARARVPEIPPDRAEQAVREGAVLVDVREADEYATGHVPGALHISRGLLEFRFSAMPALQPRELPLVLYCKSGSRAALAGAALLDMGYLDVQNMAGGWDAWVAAGLPVARP